MLVCYVAAHVLMVLVLWPALHWHFELERRREISGSAQPFWLPAPLAVWIAGEFALWSIAVHAAGLGLVWFIFRAWNRRTHRRQRTEPVLS